jgi:hypothetical protein
VDIPKSSHVWHHLRGQKRGPLNRDQAPKGIRKQQVPRRSKYLTDINLADLSTITVDTQEYWLLAI